MYPVIVFEPCRSSMMAGTCDTCDGGQPSCSSAMNGVFLSQQDRMTDIPTGDRSMTSALPEHSLAHDSRHWSPDTRCIPQTKLSHPRTDLWGQPGAIDAHVSSRSVLMPGAAACRGGNGVNGEAPQPRDGSQSRTGRGSEGQRGTKTLYGYTQLRAVVSERSLEHAACRSSASVPILSRPRPVYNLKLPKTHMLHAKTIKTFLRLSAATERNERRAKPG